MTRGFTHPSARTSGTITRRSTLLALAGGAAAAAGCAGGPASGGWTTLIDGERGLDNFNRIGDANWRAEGGAIVADRGKGGFLVSKASYRDFELDAEFWAETDTNSGIFLRLSDPTTVTAANSYEVNIWDIRPDPKYGTGAIVDFAAVPVPLANKAGGRWNRYQISLRGPRITVRLNGVETVALDNGKFAGGPLALQFGPGVQGVNGGPIRWRKVLVRPL